MGVHDGPEYAPMNLGNPGEYSMLELAETVLSLVGGHSKIVYRPLPEDDPKQRQPDISLAKSELNWEPTVGLTDGLKETIAYFRSTLGK
jgi:UDP-glucuronate decarboxylase